MCTKYKVIVLLLKKCLKSLIDRCLILQAEKALLIMLVCLFVLFLVGVNYI